MKKFWIAGGIIVVLVLIYGFTTYNRLVTTNESVNTQWAQVETVYQRRFDLIPGLINSVKGVLVQEQTIFKNIADARARYSGATTPDARAQAATEVETSLSRLLVIVENYPVLKSIDAVTGFMSQLEGSENRISVERNRYNDIVRAYNVTVKTFPASIIASITGFAERSYFEANAGAENAPVVDLKI